MGHYVPLGTEMRTEAWTWPVSCDIPVFPFLDLRPSHLTPGNFGKRTGTSIMRADLVVTSFIMSLQRETGKMLCKLKYLIASKTVGQHYDHLTSAMQGGLPVGTSAVRLVSLLLWWSLAILSEALQLRPNKPLPPFHTVGRDEPRVHSDKG